jgi:LEA14-like dessication related protein
MLLKNRAFVILFFFSLVILSSSCTVLPVELKSIGDVGVKNIQNNTVTLQVSATIANPNQRLKIKSSELILSVGTTELGKITQLESIVLKGKSTETYTTRVKFELTNSSVNMFSLYRLLERDKRDFRVSGKVKVSALFFSKTINFSGYQVFN